ncbi:DUF3047 domain-containing protein [Desulfomicrobium sp. ZS1]|uniref:DUF3047 domain-containing protein n=1 Tax=Desulfomicrobium sp. ZS1 TaxID=2952228 RepID=UPI0020B36146|nr:DUF3047 domain-containing protein [Desulfomicrobium sp. ZS1]UTF51400.1 DUF3047 domain-containing protein [Desulfomicrobium sp. ZS1]
MNASGTEKMRERSGRIFLPALQNAGMGPWARVVLAAVFMGWACVALAGGLPALYAPGHPGWKEKEFAGRTVYTPLHEEKLLLAESNGTASGFFFEQSIDLRETPWLNWSWKVENVLQGVKEREKGGDDYPARIYVVAKGGLAFWKTKALSYVWSSAESEGAMWPSAFTSSAYMVAVRSGTARVGELVTEKRNIREDWKQAFGEDIEEIDAVAIMTDTDNSGQSARAWYGQPWFSKQ